jgi:hypothetical protein
MIILFEELINVDVSGGVSVVLASLLRSFVNRFRIFIRISVLLLLLGLTVLLIFGMMIAVL